MGKDQTSILSKQINYNFKKDRILPEVWPEVVRKERELEPCHAVGVVTTEELALLVLNVQIGLTDSVNIVYPFHVSQRKKQERTKRSKTQEKEERRILHGREGE